MAVLDPLIGLRVEDAARLLELHPLEVIRILAVSGQLPRNLRLDGEDIARVRHAGGLQTWWDVAAPVDLEREGAVALFRAVIAQIITHDAVEPRYTRADNLFRRLSPDLQVALRRWVNALIREQYLVTSMAPSGLLVSASAAGLADLREFAVSGAGPLAALAGEV